VVYTSGLKKVTPLQKVTPGGRRAQHTIQQGREVSQLMHTSADQWQVPQSNTWPSPHHRCPTSTSVHLHITTAAQTNMLYIHTHPNRSLINLKAELWPDAAASPTKAGISVRHEASGMSRPDHMGNRHSSVPWVYSWGLVRSLTGGQPRRGSAPAE
jgi:hypothetical protein